MKTYSGFNPQTAQNLLLDSGALFVNFDINNDTFETAMSKLVGATTGGGTFEAKPTIRNIKVDGVKGNAKGLQILDKWDVSFASKILEFRKETFQRALAAATATAATIAGGKSYTKIQAKNQIDLTDYMDNITWIGTISGSNDPVIIQIFNVLSTDGLKFSPKDSSDIETDVKFEGSYDTTQLQSPPFAIYYPNISTDTTPPTVTTAPADNATAVAVTSSVIFTFSEAINPTTVNPGNFMLVKSTDGTVVASTLTQSTDNTTVTLKPVANLSAATAYIAIATTGVKDVNGNSLASNTVVNFTTA